MPEITELVPLLYRARWLQSTLSGEVRSYVRNGPADDDGKQPGPADADLEWVGHLDAAPGGRYRADLTDEGGDRPVYGGSLGGTPFGELLDPSRLLASFDLAVTGEAEHVGRAAWVVTGRPRPAGTGRDSGAAHGHRRRDRGVTALVDAELGILLRIMLTGPGDEAEIAEFTRLSVSPSDAVDPDIFIPADRAAMVASAEAGDEAGRAPATPPAAIPSTLTDDQVRLLYGAGLRSLRLSAEVREWADPGPSLQRAREFLAGTNIGGRTRRLWEPILTQPPARAADHAGRLLVALPDQYRIDISTDPGRRPAHVVCDGRRLWRAYADRVAVRDAEPLPRALTRLLDPAWLLNEHQVSAAGLATESGRQVLCLVAVPSQDSMPISSTGLLSRMPALGDKAELAIDLELGIMVREAWYVGDEPIVICELHDVATEIDTDAFHYEPPPGIRVITGGLLAETGLTPASAAWSLAKGTGKLAGAIGRHWLRGPRP